jgi:hypothetical protein
MDGVLFFTVSPDPADPAALWAGSWGNDIGVTTDGGLTLQPLHNGLETLSVLSILRHPTPGQYTIGTIAGLFRSDDGGASWFKLPGPLAEQTVYALHQGTDGVIWAGSANGLWSSADYGATWAPAPGVPPRTVIRLGELTGALTGEGASELTGNGPPRLWAGTEDSGLWLSADAGATWQFGGLDGRSIYALIAVPADSPGEGARLVAATDAGLRTGR